MEQNVSPTPNQITNSNQDADAEKYTFPEAMVKLIFDGAKITRLGWGDKTEYAVLRDGWLQIHKAGDPEDKFFAWSVHEKDLRADDWVTVNV